MASLSYPARANQRARWLVSYADLTTLLLAVFVVLFAAAQKRPLPSGTKQAANSPAKPQLASVQPGVEPPPERVTQALFGRLNEVLAPGLKTRNVALQRLPQGIVIRMSEEGSFRTGDAVPLPTVRQTLHEIASIAGPTGASIRVEGYTDDEPIRTRLFRSNWELSTARAQAVLSLLLTEPVLNPANLSVAGYGPYHPLASNSTEAGRRLNRRIDLVVIPKPAD